MGFKDNQIESLMKYNIVTSKDQAINLVKVSLDGKQKHEFIPADIVTRCAICSLGLNEHTSVNISVMANKLDDTVDPQQVNQNYNKSTVKGDSLKKQSVNDSCVPLKDNRPT